MFGIVTVVLAHGVMEQCKKEHGQGVRSHHTACQIGAERRHTLPVTLAM
jgi:hypothetical protein